MNNQNANDPSDLIGSIREYKVGNVVYHIIPKNSFYRTPEIRFTGVSFENAADFAFAITQLNSNTSVRQSFASHYAASFSSTIWVRGHSNVSRNSDLFGNYAVTSTGWHGVKNGKSIASSTTDPTPGAGVRIITPRFSDIVLNLNLDYLLDPARFMARGFVSANAQVTGTIFHELGHNYVDEPFASSLQSLFGGHAEPLGITVTGAYLPIY